MNLEFVGVQQVADTLNRQLRELGLDDNLAQVARDAGMEKHQLYSWLQAKTKRGYDAASFEKLCFLINLNPSKVLFGNIPTERSTEDEPEKTFSDEQIVMLEKCIHAAVRTIKEVGKEPTPESISKLAASLMQ